MVGIFNYYEIDKLILKQYQFNKAQCMTYLSLNLNELILLKRTSSNPEI